MYKTGYHQLIRLESGHQTAGGSIHHSIAESVQEAMEELFLDTLAEPISQPVTESIHRTKADLICENKAQSV